MLPTSYLEDLKASNVEDADEGGALPLGSVERLVDPGHEPLEHPLVARLGDGLHGKLHLYANTDKHDYGRHAN